MHESVSFLTQKDPILKQIVLKYGIPEIPKREEGFISLIQIILEQQVSIASAKAHFIKLQDNLVQINPNSIIKASPETLRNCGISRQKIVYLKDAAAKILDNSVKLHVFQELSESEIRKQLLSIKGVGVWTTDVYLQFCLGLPDIIPLGDIAVRNTIKELYEIQDLKKMEILSQKWRPFRSMATFLLWQHYLEKRKKK
ncbi:MAG: DNA-3-methyladenine glycosylase II [Flavobacterium sp.]|jgi:DNA-3-methyladenine glycosylase II